MASSKYDAFEIPGVGEIQAREGTSTHELAGAVKVWHDRYQEAHNQIWAARRQGTIAGIAMLSMVEIFALVIYRLLH